jgi:[methyl-Co(III) methanol-specific corrinoid protein]:coenzyme M methyltransferase
LSCWSNPSPVHRNENRPNLIHDALLLLSSFLAQIGRAYREAGADFLTIHEMGGSPGFLGALRFEEFVFPALHALIDELPRPRILAVCGNLEAVSSYLPLAGAEPLSVDQTNNLAALRAALPESLLFGNVDPVAVLAHGTPDDVRASALLAIESGVDAVWPGCDLSPATPPENLRAMLES